MNVLSCFDGISCARVALERAGIPVKKYYASEIDKYAIQIAQKNYPDTIQVGSVVGLDCAQFKNIGLLIGGSPCQDLSIAKKDRKGLDGERSGLFWEYVRILNEVKPKYFVLENVASMPKEARALITETLGVEPVMIDAAKLSAQRRKRLFWVGKRTKAGYVQVAIPQPEDRGILLEDILEDNNGVALTETRTEEAKRIRREYQKAGRDFSPRRAKELVPRTDGKSNTLTTGMTKEHLIMKQKSNTIRADGRSSGLGDKHEWDSVYQYRRTYWRETKGGKVPTLTANMGTGGNNVPYVRQPDGTLKVREATKKGYAIAKEGDAIDLSFPNSKTRRGRVGNKAKNIMTGAGAIHVVTKDDIRKLSCVECERLQSLNDGHTEGVSNTQRYKALGNAFNVEVVAHILRHIVLK